MRHRPVSTLSRHRKGQKLPVSDPGIHRMGFFGEVTPNCTEILTTIDLGWRKPSNIGQLAEAASPALTDLAR